MSDPVSGIVTASAKEVATAIAPAAKRLGAKAFDRLKIALTDCFSSHLSSAQTRCRSVKNIMYRDEAVDIYTQYVSAEFKTIKSSKKDSEIVDDVVSGKRILISGKAGFGKTMFMKWATLELINSRIFHHMYSIFLELRYMNEEDAKSGVLKYIVDKSSTKKGLASEEQIEIGLENGMFIFILDAVDEISPKFRQKVISDIRDLLRRYPRCPALISSRPDDALEALQDLIVVRSMPMNKKQIIKVLKNLDYDIVFKNKLINHLSKGLFERQKDFLSNPLLATIMLLTYDNSADIPNKVTTFYRQAFEALYQRHDAHKGTFRRDHHAGLPMDEFEYIFSIFCYKTLIENRFEFNDSDLMFSFRSAISFSGINTNPSLILRDSIESASLLQKEGLDNVFVHRSFQEYFAALFIAGYRGPNPTALIDAASHGKGMLKMLLDLKPDLLEFEWILPRSVEWLGIVENLDLNTANGLRVFFESTIDYFELNPFDGNILNYHNGLGKASEWMSGISEIYPGYNFISQLFQKRITNLSMIDSNTIRPSSEHHNNIGGSSLEHKDHQSETRYRVESKDADWLVHTNFVGICRDIRQQVQLTAKRIQERQRSASEQVRTLLRPSRLAGLEPDP